MYRIGIDVGGTFTDLVAVEDTGKIVCVKAPSRPADPARSVLDGLGRLAGALGSELDVLLHETERIVHGTTVATNALLEGKGARVGLLTTESHRDVIEMREGLKEDRYNLRMSPPRAIGSAGKADRRAGTDARGWKDDRDPKCAFLAARDRAPEAG